MIHIYKHGGDWTRDDIEYTVKVVSYKRLEEYLSKGWVDSFDKLKENKTNVDGGEREKFLRAEIKKLSGKHAGPSSTMETLEARYLELKEQKENGDD